MNTSKRMAASILLVVLFACFLSTSLFVRQSGSTTSLLTHYASRILEIAACFIIAFIARDARINTSSLIRVGLGLLAATLLFEGCGIVLPAGLFEGQIIILDTLAGSFKGVLMACAILLFARAFCEQPPQRARVLIPAGWACSHVIFLASYLIPRTAIPALELVMLVGSTAGLFFMIPRGLVASSPSKAPSQTQRLAIVPLLKSSRYFSLYFGMLVFPFFYGLMAQICTDAGVSSGLFDVATEIVGLVILVLIAVSAPLQKGRLDAETLFVILLPLFATALLFLPLFWDSEVFVSGFIMKCGFLAYTALLWVNLQQLTNKAPHTCFFFFGIALGLYHLALMVGRFFAFLLGTFTELDENAIATAALVAIWLLSMAALVMLLTRRHKRPVPFVSKGVSDFSSACALFAERYELSEREALVCQEFARGRTVSHIANELIVSQETVKTYVKRLYAKSGCHNRQDLIDKLDELAQER